MGWENPTTRVCASRTSAGRGDPSPPSRRFALGDDVLDHVGDQAAQKLVRPPSRFDARMQTIHLAQDVARDRQVGKLIEREQLRPQAVVDVVRVVGDIVGQRRGLRLGAGEAP